jgi:hypothetical protein
MNISDLFDLFGTTRHKADSSVDEADREAVLEELKEHLLRQREDLDEHDPVALRHFAEMLAEYQHIKYGFIDPSVQRYL